jgi:hypothetical protein
MDMRVYYFSLFLWAAVFCLLLLGILRPLATSRRAGAG